ncbi:acetyl-CoA carboxylase biotin carboxylase subunit [Phreatobacter stygius]|uniref:Acetyl-CoA carboxylase biotin carboxylase subunit n=2 Tax=Phreatobacter stygius TaxID=1940610 RepID=A0A4D7B7F5_9HYPH|nr:acetyl-CoA carboxylase biotin carboxylase subunit [Phreatobacter stygius]
MTAATPFTSVLIANRGEIALRIMRTARRMGHGVVAVYSSADAGAQHVHAADRAVHIGEALPSQSYLAIDRIIAAAKASGADAVHPGYGFLAENADFARACRAAGLVFIGPSPEAIDAMGNKAGAKTIMAGAGVPVVPGYQGADQGEARLAEEAARIGFPVMIKAVAGGGGRGMRLVPDAARFTDLLRSARSEAENAFGDPTVILERAIIDPRHIEIQVFGDRHGGAVHLGERDCSVQRRHQKLVEEAPSPVVSADLRARMGATAVKAVKALGYEGAGTLEFLLEPDGAFYFMEMNTRLQVEHPVTELITGLDLVEWQLRVAAGEPLPLGQQAIGLAGHAIEVRLCAEDPAHDFMPQSGSIAYWAMPGELRVETAVGSGTEIPPFYDSMIAKVIAHGATRDEARRKLIAGLTRAAVLGIPTNQGFLARVLDHPAFAAGQATTGFVAEHGETLKPGPGQGLPAPVLAALLFYVTDTAPAHRGTTRHLGPPLPVPMLVEIDGVKAEVGIYRDRDGSHRIQFDGQDRRIQVDGIGPNALRFSHDGVADTLVFARAGAALFLQQGADAVAIRDLTRAVAEIAGADDSDGRLLAAMNGRIVAVHVAAGDQVAAGQPIVTLEAMKMEHVHTAPVAGTITDIGVAAGEQVTTHRLIARIEAAAA